MPRIPRPSALAVSASTIKKTAIRVLNGQQLVSSEIDYLVRTMSSRATQQEIDTMVLRVRSMPWASIVPAE